MNAANETIRELSAAEIDEIAGARRLEIGRLYVKIGRDDVAFGFGIKGLFDISVFSDGDVRGHVG